MKIAFLAEAFLADGTTGVNGTQVQMFNLARAIAGRGHEVHYFTITRSGEMNRDIVDGIDVHPVYVEPGLFSWRSSNRRFKRLLDETVPEVVYQRGRSGLTHLAAAWARKNNRCFIWGSNGDDSCDFWKGMIRLRMSSRPIWRKALLYPYNALRDILIHRGVRGADLVVNQTRHQRERLAENYTKEGIVLPSYFERSDIPPMSAKEMVCLWAANPAPGKRPEIFIELARMSTSLKNWRFILVGGSRDQAYQDEVRKMASSSANLEMTGTVPYGRMGEYYSRASLFVSTSMVQADGISNAMIQAWLSGVPVLSLDHDPNGWIEKHGLGFYARGDTATFMSAGRRMLEDTERLAVMGARCARFSLERFTDPSIVDTYLELMSRCLEEKGIR